MFTLPIHICDLLVSVPQEATIASIETAVLREYGECIHTAMKGCDSDLCYFRHVAHVLLPLVLPPNMIQSRWAK